MKIGIEVEGRLKGIKTLFCDAQELVGARALFADDKTLSSVKAIYVSDHDNTLDPSSSDLAWLIDQGIFITLEVTQVTEKWPDEVSIMLHVESDSYWFLKPTDQIKFHRGDQRVDAFAVESAYKTMPEDFEGDQEL